jgi:hypothetical protein
MLSKLPFLLLNFFLVGMLHSQPAKQDTIYLMNGHVIAEKVIDTLLGAVTIYNPKKHSQKLHYEYDQLYMVRFASGFRRYYYVQDSTIYNWFTRDEMWMYMKGENDARKGFKARGALIGSGIAGMIGGMTGTIWGPVAPYTFMALSGIPKVRIRHGTISNPAYVQSDAYILGYERVARQKLKLKSLIGGTIGLAVGYAFYAVFHNSYPQTVNFGFNK